MRQVIARILSRYFPPRGFAFETPLQRVLYLSLADRLRKKRRRYFALGDHPLLPNDFFLSLALAFAISTIGAILFGLIVW